MLLLENLEGLIENCRQRVVNDQRCNSNGNLFADLLTDSEVSSIFNKVKGL